MKVNNVKKNELRWETRIGEREFSIVINQQTKLLIVNKYQMVVSLLSFLIWDYYFEHIYGDLKKSYLINRFIEVIAKKF